ncbi:hypothetical protein [Streptomyces sp. NPDC014894]|uniref:nSTAND1 domain-containing NTPase n=1 Tax=Streptomyces sp. NPDC014894 TaxID=3364931 RepID=UPI0036FFC5AF
MGRRERPLDPDGGPAARFAHALRTLRGEAGGLTYRAMARRTHYSTTTLAQAAAGDRLPSLPVALAYAAACGGDLAEWERRWHEADRALAEETPGRGPDAVAPYPGLARFEPRDADRFFGRDSAVERLAALVAERPCVLLVGASGSGKSSLLRAGLIPRLRDGSGRRARPAAVRVLTPGDRPARRQGLLETDRPDGVVIVDQFEEIFTLCSDEGERSAFIDAMLAATGRGGRLVIAVRSDFYGHCARHRALAEAAGGGTLLLPPMSRDELREAIVKPAAGAGLLVERSLTARIVAEIADEPGGMPLMSHALRETWRLGRGRTLTEETYETAGGLHGAIARTAEELYEALTPRQRRIGRHLLLRLVAPGRDGAQDTRRPVSRAELTAVDPGEADAVVERLARARLITLDEDTVDLAHEALLTAWPRLSGWLEEDRERLRQLRRLTESATAWASLGHDPGALYRGVRLTSAERHFTGAGERPGELTDVEAGFLAAALRARARGLRRSRARLTVLCCLLVLALVAGLFAWQQHGDAERRRIEDAARRTAGVAESLRRSDPAAAMRLGLAAWRIAELPETRSALLSAAFQPELGSFTDPDTADTTLRHLSADGRTLLSAGERRTVEWDVATARPRRAFPGLGGALTGAAAPRGDASWLPAFTGADTAEPLVGARDLVTGRARGPLVRAAGGAEMGDSGRTLITYERTGAAGKRGQRVVVRDARDGRVLIALPALPWPEPRLGDVFPGPGSLAQELRRSRERRGADSVQEAVLSADDRYLAHCVPGEAVQLWDVARRRPLRQPRAPVVTAQQCLDESLHFTPDATGLAVVGPAGVRILDLATGRERTRIDSPGVTGIRFSDDGRFLVLVDRTALSVAPAEGSGRPVFRHTLLGESASQPRIAASGLLTYLGSPDDHWGTTVRTLDIAHVLRPRRRAATTATAFSPDGSLLATAFTDGGRARFRVRDLRTARWHELPGRSCAPGGPPPHDLCPAFVAFRPDSRVLAYGTTGTGRRAEPLGVSFWDTERRRVSHKRFRPPDRVDSWGAVAYAPDGRSLVLAVLAPDGPAYLWDPRRRTPTSVLRGAGGHALAFSPDGGLLVTSAGRSRRLPSGPAAEGARDIGSGVSLAFSPDGRYLAAGELSGRVTLWDGRLRRRLGELTAQGPGAASSVMSLAFSPDARLLAVGSGDGTLRIWDTASRRPAGSPLPTPGGGVIDVRFGEDGATLFAAGNNVPFQRYEIGPSAAARTVCRRAGGPLSRSAWKRLIPDVPHRDICAGAGRGGRAGPRGPAALG